MAQSEQEIVEIVGLRAASSPGVTRAKNKPWGFLIKLTHWRINGGASQSGTLYSSKDVDLKEVPALREAFPALAVVRFKAIIKPDTWNDGRVRTTFVEPLSPIPDAEFDAIARGLKAPVVVTDSELGDLKLNREFGIFETKVQWMGQSVPLDMPAKNDGLDSAELTLAKTFMAAQTEWDERMRSYAADEMLENKNGNWLGEDETPVTKDAFMQRLKPESISLSAPDEFTVFYADGDLFFGHVIIISGTLAKGPNNATLAG